MMSAALEKRATILRIRAYIFVILVIFGILWTALLCIYSFSKGAYHSRAETVSVIFFLTSQALTTICIPILIILDHSDTVEKSRWHGHAWFEIVCLGGLFACQFTAALLFTLLSTSFNCNDANVDIQADCQLVNLYISMASWLTPLILLSFLVYMIIVCYRASRRSPNVWRTTIRLGPWDHDVVSLYETTSNDVRPSTLNKPRSLEERSTAFLSRPSSYESPTSTLRGSMQSQPSFERRVYDNAFSPRHPTISAPQPLSPTRAQGSTRMPRSLPPLRAVSQPPPPRPTTFGQPTTPLQMSRPPPHHRAVFHGVSPTDSFRYSTSLAGSSSTGSRDSRRIFQRV